MIGHELRQPVAFCWTFDCAYTAIDTVVNSCSNNVHGWRITASPPNSPLGVYEITAVEVRTIWLRKVAHSQIYFLSHDDDVYPRETPSHIRTARASPQRYTAAGTAAPTTADTGNTVPQLANPTQTAYAHPRRKAQAQGQALRHMDAGPSTKRSRGTYSTQGCHREIGTSTINISDVGFRPGFLPPSTLEWGNVGRGT